MIERHDGRSQRFEVRLDPPELGRVDVRVEIGPDKKVRAVLAAHDSAALSDLVRGAKTLETALRQAGLDVADGGLRFEAGSGSSSNSGSGADRGARPAFAGLRDESVVLQAPATAEEAGQARSSLWSTGRLNLVA
jgi:flagellar hook-length control protein FliK